MGKARGGRGTHGCLIPILSFLKAPIGGWRGMNQDPKLPEGEWQTGLLLPIYYDSEFSSVVSGPASASATDSETLGFCVFTHPPGGSNTHWSLSPVVLCVGQSAVPVVCSIKHLLLFWLLWPGPWIHADLSRYCVFFGCSEHPCSCSTSRCSFWPEFEGLTPLLEQMNSTGRKWEREQGPVGFSVGSTLQFVDLGQPRALRAALATLFHHGVRICPGISSLDFLEGWWFVEVI